MSHIDYDSDFDENAAPITELSKPQRRVLGVLVEKAFTTPDQYPLTLKALTSGANQKSNRAPVTNYSGDALEEAMEELRELGLAAVVHTDTGRTERFRHYMRRRFSFTEPQLAIITELMLRGRQSLGELRARASRMVAIDSLDDLRHELKGLQDMGYLQATNALERRGTEVDHTLYRDSENRTLTQTSHAAQDDERPSAPPRPAPAAAPVQAAASVSPEFALRLESLERTCDEQRLENQQLRAELDALKQTVDEATSQLEDLRQSLGG